MVFKKKDPNATPAPTSGPSAPAASGTSPVKTEGDAPSAGASASADPDTPSERIRKKRLDVNPSLIINTEGGRSKRRRSPSPAPPTVVADQEDLDPKDPVRAKELGMQIYNMINDSKTSEGESMSHPFHKLPNKRSFPDYYETIKHPMSLEMVHSKLEASEYQTLKEVCTDLGQIFNNAKRYNVKESLIFLWAKKLHKKTRTFYASHTSRNKEESDSENETDRATSTRAATMQPGTSADGRDASVVAGHGAGGDGGAGRGVSVAGDVDLASASADEGREKKKRAAYQMREGPTVYKLVKPVLKTVKEAVSNDGSGRLLSTMFEQLPDRKDLPDYYRTIKNPISLEEIEIKQTGRRYETYQEFFDDVELMCKNAMEYNADESEVYRDAKEIQDLMVQQLAEVQIRLSHPPGTKSYKIKAAAAAAAAAVTPLRVGTMHTSTYPSASPSVSQSPVPTPGAPPPLPPINYPPSTSTPISAPTPRSAIPYGSLPPGSIPYIPTLQPNHVTEDIVASLERYTPYEQQAWLRSLSPYNMNVYRHLAAVVEARRRGAIAPPPLTAVPPPAPSPAQVQQMPVYPFQQQPAQVQQVQTVTPSPAPLAMKRNPPAVPTIKFIDFAFTPAGPDTGVDAAVGGGAKDFTAQRQAVRLRNFRGVVTHCVILNTSTSDVEITAYPEARQTIGEAGGLDPASSLGSLGIPDVTLRVNGVQGSLPKFVLGSAGGFPQGVRWTVHVPVTRAESKIEVVVARAGAGAGTGTGEGAETTTIYLNRQY